MLGTFNQSVFTDVRSRLLKRDDTTEKKINSISTDDFSVPDSIAASIVHCGRFVLSSQVEEMDLRF